MLEPSGKVQRRDGEGFQEFREKESSIDYEETGQEESSMLLLFGGGKEPFLNGLVKTFTLSWNQQVSDQ